MMNFEMKMEKVPEVLNFKIRVHRKTLDKIFTVLTFLLYFENSLQTFYRRMENILKCWTFVK